MKESSERVFQAIENTGYAIKARQTLINLAPADVKKEGPSLDLPIAVVEDAIAATIAHEAAG